MLQAVKCGLTGVGLGVWHVITPGSQGSGPAAGQCVRVHMAGCVGVGMLCANDRHGLAGSIRFGTLWRMLLSGGASEVGVECGVGGGFGAGITRERAAGACWLPQAC